MKVILAKDFQKAMHKQSGKILNSIRKAVQEVVDAKSLDDTVIFRYLVNRGDAYSKEMKKNLKRIDD